MKRTFALALAVLAAGILTAAAAAADPSRSDSPRTIRIATEIGYAPYEVYAADGKTVQGLDVDLWNALGKALDVKFTIQDGTYANIIPSLEAKRADVGWSAMALSSFVGLKQAKFLIYERRSFSGVVVRRTRPSRPAPTSAVRASASRTAKPHRSRHSRTSARPRASPASRSSASRRRRTSSSLSSRDRSRAASWIRSTATTS